MTQEELKDLYKGCVLTGRLSEVHIKNMQTYPFGAFDGVTEVATSYDIVLDPSQELMGKKSKVKYEVKTAAHLSQEEKDIGTSFLKKSLSVIFFQDVSVEVDFK